MMTKATEITTGDPKIDKETALLIQRKNMVPVGLTHFGCPSSCGLQDATYGISRHDHQFRWTSAKYTIHMDAIHASEAIILVFLTGIVVDWFNDYQPDLGSSSK